jgi:hypothetical protein
MVATTLVSLRAVAQSYAASLTMRSWIARDLPQLKPPDADDAGQRMGEEFAVDALALRCDEHVGDPCDAGIDQRKDKPHGQVASTALTGWPCA